MTSQNTCARKGTCGMLHAQSSQSCFPKHGFISTGFPLVLTLNTFHTQSSVVENAHLDLDLSSISAQPNQRGLLGLSDSALRYVHRRGNGRVNG